MEPIRLGIPVVQETSAGATLNLNWIEKSLGSRVRLACEEILKDPANRGLCDRDIVEQARQFVRVERGEDIGVLDDVPFTSD